MVNSIMFAKNNRLKFSILPTRILRAGALIATAMCFFAAQSRSMPPQRSGGAGTYLEYVAARVLIEEGHLAQAAAALEKIVAADPDAAAAHRDLAETYLKMGEIEKAMAYADEIARRYADRETYRFLATFYFYAFSHSRAAYYFEKLLEEEPDDEDALAFLANYYSTVKPDEAIKYLDRLAAHNPEDASVFVRLAAVYEKLNLYETAIGHYRKSMELDPGLKEGHLAISRIYEVMRDTRAAIGEYGAYLSADPDNIAVLSYLGALYFATGDIDKAKDTFERLVSVSTSPAVRIWLGAVAAEKGELLEAVRYFEKAAAAEPSAQVYQYIAELQIRRKDFEAAQLAAEKSARMSPDDPKILMLAALVRMDRRDYGGAIKFLNEALRVAPNSEEAIFYKAVALDNTKRFKAMRASLERLISLNPSHHQAKNYLAYSLAARGMELDYALNLALDALKISPDTPAYIDTLGWIYFKKGRYEDAERELVRAVEMQRDWEIYFHVGEVKEKLGKEREAISAYCFSLYYGAPGAEGKETKKRLARLAASHNAETLFGDLIRNIISEIPPAEKIDAGFAAKSPAGTFRGKASFRSPSAFTLDIGEGLFKTFIRLERNVEYFPFAPAIFPDDSAENIMSVLRSVFSGGFYETMTNAAARTKGGDMVEIDTADAKITASRFTGDVLKLDTGRSVWKFSNYAAVRGHRIPLKIEFFDGRTKIFEAAIHNPEIE
ncbi:MAG: hypothetical protein CVU77_04745 [Elusimicrobia bacterium HGW-Elusimicrobia-1]|nr:MAG: hypothetical protein CVU77_04745 [Elusimicrobia bacterium HGW-Elusimicrobia-1]